MKGRCASVYSKLVRNRNFTECPVSYLASLTHRLTTKERSDNHNNHNFPFFIVHFNVAAPREYMRARPSECKRATMRTWVQRHAGLTYG